MHGMDKDFPNSIEFLEVEEPSRLIYQHGDPKDPYSFHVTVLFESLEPDSTLITMTSQFQTVEALDELDRTVKAIEGGKQHMQRMADYVHEWVKKIEA